MEQKITVSRKTIHYDLFGNPTPYDIINLTQDDIYTNFVDTRKDKAARAVLYNGYKNYFRDLLRLIGENFEQFIDGSFTTLKQLPGDVDVVNIISADTIDRLNRSLDPYLTRTGTPKLSYHVDGYAFPHCPPSDPRYDFFCDRTRYWLNHFGKDREGRQKGIVKTMVVKNDN